MSTQAPAMGSATPATTVVVSLTGHYECTRRKGLYCQRTEHRRLPGEQWLWGQPETQ